MIAPQGKKISPAEFGLWAGSRGVFKGKYVLHKKDKNDENKILTLRAIINLTNLGEYGNVF